LAAVGDMADRVRRENGRASIHHLRGLPHEIS
jgi:hypothetical protein